MLVYFVIAPILIGILLYFFYFAKATRIISIVIQLGICLAACYLFFFSRENLLMYVSYPKQLTLRVFFRSLHILFLFSWSRHRVVACMLTIICEKPACLILKLEVVMEAADFFICPNPEI